MKMKITILALAVAATPQTRATINRAFRSDDFEVVWTANPTEAALASVRHNPDLLLLDLDPASTKGRKVFENLKTANPDARVVVLTENSTTRTASVAGPADVVIEKPFDVGILTDTVHQLFKTPEADDEHRRTIEIARKYREELRIRANAALAIATPCERWGINE